MMVGGQRHAPAALPPGKSPITHCRGEWLGPRAGLDGQGFAVTGVQTPDFGTHRELLHQQRCPGPLLFLHWLV